MKRRGTSRIFNGQSRSGARVEWLPASANPNGPLATDEWRSTLIDHHQAWGQDLWPDCLD